MHNIMGSKKKHERSKSRKKHEHSKHRKKHKHKKKSKHHHVNEVIDDHDSSDKETTASTQEALEQYNKILSALEEAGEPPEVEKSEASSSVIVVGAEEVVVISSPDDKEHSRDGDQQPEVETSGEQSPNRTSSPAGAMNDQPSISCQSPNEAQIESRPVLSNSQSLSKGHRSRSRGHWSHSRGRRSHSRGRRSHSRGRWSHSRGRWSHSRDRRSRSRGRRSRSRGRWSHSRERRHRRYSSRSLSRERRNYRRHRRRNSSSSSRSRSPRRKTRLVIEKVPTPPPQEGTLQSFMTFCQELSKKVQELPDINFPINEDQQAGTAQTYNAGSKQKLLFHNNAWKTATQVVTERTMTTSVAEVFPCSSGAKHQKMELNPAADETPTQQQEAIDITALSQRRLVLQQQLQANPSDIQAYSSYLQVEQQIAQWSENQKLGQFTGEKKVAVFSGKDLHASGRQAWVKKDMFNCLNPVRSDCAVKMMKKMGWVEGTPLGKTGTGHILPPVLNFQVDRKGLVSDIDSIHIAPVHNIIKSNNRYTPSIVKGKHPVSALQELAAKKQWVVSWEEVVVIDKPGFMYKVTVPLGTFQPETTSGTKKQAKFQAAVACLVGIGILSPEEAKSISSS